MSIVFNLDCLTRHVAYLDFVTEVKLESGCEQSIGVKGGGSS